jgi:hypothetical protein
MNVFISYRRSDTQDLAGRIADRIRAVPDVDHVFIDVDGIEPGADFAQKIQTALAGSPVCILLIGPKWLGARADGGTARIFEDRDFVRLEAAAALASEQKVLPVLANGAPMPHAEELPEDLHRLPGINALSVRHLYFDHDIEYLIDVLLSRKKPAKVTSYLRHHPFQAGVLRALAGACSALAILVFGAGLHRALTHRSLDESLGGAGQVWLLIIGLFVSGALVALLTRPRRRSSHGGRLP